MIYSLKKRDKDRYVESLVRLEGIYVDNTVRYHLLLDDREIGFGLGIWYEDRLGIAIPLEEA